MYVLSVNINKIICTVNSDKPEHPVNSSTLVRPVNSINFVLSVDIRTVDSNKPLRPLILISLCVLLMFVNLYPL